MNQIPDNSSLFFYDNPPEENVVSSSPPDHIISSSFAKAYSDINNLQENDTKADSEKNDEELPTENDKDELEDNGNSIIQSNSRILLMGLPRSGKSSIQSVVFHKMAPNETFFLESTTKIVKNKVTNSSFVQFQLWDFPGQSVNTMVKSDKDAEKLFKKCGAIIFVVDSQVSIHHDNYQRPLAKFVESMVKAKNINPNLKYELFIHKVDGLSDEQKIETQRSIYQILKEEMHEAELRDLNIKFYMTSIYDYSIYEAVSKVVQQLIPQLPTLENLLNIFISGSGMEKAFLCDVVSKIYIATDSNPVDMQTYELCCDMIDVVIDLQCIYGMPDDDSYCPFDSRSYCAIRLNTSTVLYLREVNQYLALVCIVREENFKKEGIIDYNFECLKNAIKELFELERSTKASATTTTTQRPTKSDQDSSPRRRHPDKSNGGGGSSDEEEDDEEGGGDILDGSPNTTTTNDESGPDDIMTATTTTKSSQSRSSSPSTSFGHTSTADQAAKPRTVPQSSNGDGTKKSSGARNSHRHYGTKSTDVGAEIS